MKQITAEEWRNKHKDFKSIIDGQRHILTLVEGVGTCLIPVEVIGLRKPNKKV